MKVNRLNWGGNLKLVSDYPGGNLNRGGGVIWNYYTGVDSTKTKVVRDGDVVDKITTSQTSIN